MAFSDDAQCVETILSTLTDADEDAGRERDRQFAGCVEGGQTSLRTLVRCAAMALEVAVQRLEHHPLACRHRPQDGEFSV